MDRQKLEAQLKIHEGVEYDVYIDTRGNPTIGVGFNLRRSDAREKLRNVGMDYDRVLAGRGTLDKEQVSILLQQDIDYFYEQTKSIIKNFDKLNDVRQRVCVDMCFNLGVAGFRKFKGTIAHIEKEEFDDASDHMLNSLWARQVKGRADHLATMMRTGKDVYRF